MFFPGDAVRVSARFEYVTRLLMAEAYARSMLGGDAQFRVVLKK
jgi:hypothetical protein